ncbi:beta-N-acetylhexosaminidase [Camelliibacillus cellulosilyticus]|uniref:beta-N-acetylhexosaminidase n=1 Tax=Camelliibacillus cellulosilyticus TaxID=2174486 RepID=A0ABV9GPR5_9BACL
MKRFAILVCCVGFLCLLISGCLDIKVVKKKDAGHDQLAKMTMDEKIGQMVLAGIDGTTVTSQVQSFIKTSKVGGFILYGNNIVTADQTVGLLNALKNTNVQAGNPQPLFLSVDQEGGRVNRMPSSMMNTPTNRAIGNVDDQHFAFKIGKIIGQELDDFGFNMDFAPVMDIETNPTNPVIGDRSFGMDEELVSKLGVAEMKGIRSANIIPVIKHFPGHGDTSVDSHLDLPVVNHGLTRLKNVEWRPFQSAIEQGADVVMAAHLLLPKIDADHPASLSKRLITDDLRGLLHFKGVIISDDMTMGAITKHYDIGDAAVRSIQAGCDIVLVGHGDREVNKVYSAVKKAVNTGRLSKKRMDESVLRIIKLKHKYHLADQPNEPVNVAKINKEIRTILNQKKVSDSK